MVEMEKTVFPNRTIQINAAQLDWINVDRGDTVIVKDDEGKHGRFLVIHKKGE